MEIRRIKVTDPSDIRENLVKSFKETGFAVLTGDGFHYIQDLYSSWKEFFNKPIEYKMEYKFNPNVDVQAGYFPYKTENAKDQENPDLKEFFHIYNNSDIPKDVMVTEQQHLRATLMTLAKSLLDYVEPGLSDSVNGGNSLTRAIYYPEIKNEKGVRAAAHEDINLITLLPASTNPGLQVMDSFGDWHEVGTEKGDIIVNVGDMLQMYTGGELKSTKHRVVNLPGDRLSMPTFVHPRSDFSLGKIKAVDYLSQRLREIGLKK